jgi:hypothetical protein
MAGQGTMDAVELANEVTQSKREVVFRRIFVSTEIRTSCFIMFLQLTHWPIGCLLLQSALSRVDNPTFFFSKRQASRTQPAATNTPVASQAPESVSSA